MRVVFAQGWMVYGRGSRKTSYVTRCGSCGKGVSKGANG